MVVKYDLCCELGHEFEGWFRTEEELQRQHNYGWLTCPICECSGVNRISAWTIQSLIDPGDDGYSEEYQRTKNLLREINEYIDRHNGERDDDVDHLGVPSAEKRKVRELYSEGLSAIQIPFDPGIDKDKLN